MASGGDHGRNRTERDALGAVEVPEKARWGIHTARAMANFPLAGHPVHPLLVRAMGAVKLAALRANLAIGVVPEDDVARALARACEEMMGGELLADVPVDALQGGAGTSTNMCVNEVLANRALELLGQPHGRYDLVSPLDLVNLHQSTNDAFPTALRLAAIWGLHALENEVLALQEAFQAKERELAGIVKVARTELQDAVLITLGREMSTYAEALSRDRWRVSKCEERLRVVNLGGTAVGTGLGAPREYIFRVVDELRDLTGIGFARAENLIETTANADVFVEVSGILKACATTLTKASSDLRLLSSGPDAGLAELILPARQAGSSIMPGKVNPVIPEAVTQAALLVGGYDQALTVAAGMGSLELNPFLPLIAHCLLTTLDLLARACSILASHCVAGLAADEARCRATVRSATAAVTALLPALGYEGAARLLAHASATGLTLREAAIAGGFLSGEDFDRLTSAEAVCRLGSPGAKGRS